MTNADFARIVVYAVATATAVTLSVNALLWALGVKDFWS